MNTDLEIKTILENLTAMLIARGEENVEEQIQKQLHDNTVDYKNLIELKVGSITVFFCLVKSVEKDLMYKVKDLDAEALEKQWDSTRYIMIIRITDKPVLTTISTVEEKDKQLFQHSKGYFQLFRTEELMYNPAAHVYVPHHEKIDDRAIQKMLETYQLKNRYQLPNILKTDVMAKYLGLCQGDVVRITRYNDTSGIYHYYRCCIKV